MFAEAHRKGPLADARLAPCLSNSRDNGALPRRILSHLGPVIPSGMTGLGIYSTALAVHKTCTGLDYQPAEQKGEERPMRASVVLLVAALCAGCGPVPSKQSNDVVPKELVPVGFEQSECHFVHATQADVPESRDPAGGFGAPESVLGRASNDAGGGHPAVKCQHVENTHFEQCLDSDGHEHPIQWCKDRQEGKPTSGEPGHLCSDADGLLRRCDDEG